MNPKAPQFDLKVPRADISSWAQKYSYPNEDRIVDELAPRFRDRGFLTREEFLDVCYWKTPRTQSRCAENAEEFIKEVTEIALSTSCEQLRIEALTLLKGVSWPTASVILHFGHKDPYPILDFRALWSLGVDVPESYGVEFWSAYVVFCRRLAEECAVNMRTLDRALWQYSKANQA